MTGCTCSTIGATGLERLDELINVDGWDQWRASRFLWGGDLQRSLEEARAEGRRIVRAGLSDVIAWLHAAGVKAA